jgi:hypothetical protein
MHQPRHALGADDRNCRLKAALPLALFSALENKPVLVAGRVLDEPALPSANAGVPEHSEEPKSILASPPIRDHSMRLALVPPHPDCRAA